MSDKKLSSLIKLLDDENSLVASAAMHELLEFDPLSKRMLKLMAELQESPGIRRKIHQLQAIYKARTIRKQITDHFLIKGGNLIQGLAYINFAWDSELGNVELSDMWRYTMAEAAKNRLCSPRKLSKFMLDAGFVTNSGSMQNPDLYCLGPVLEDHFGSDVLLAAIAMDLGSMFRLKGSIAYTDEGFALLIHKPGSEKSKKPEGELLIPALNWKVLRHVTAGKFQVWPCDKVLRYVTSVLFSEAICLQSPRLIQIFGSCLAGIKGNSSMADILPYPFGDRRA